MHWFRVDWWKYLLERRRGDRHYRGVLLTFLCRARGHPFGVWWYNPNGLEPDMHCKNCGDDLG